MIKGNVPGALVVEVLADCKSVLFARDAVAVAPELGSCRADFEIEPAAICEFDGLCAGLCVADFGVGQRHDLGTTL